VKTDVFSPNQTKTRFNDYGHSLLELGLVDAVGDYVILTNADNYFIAITIEFLNIEIKTQVPDVVMFDMVHSHDQN
jgi:hypothetical protein